MTVSKNVYPVSAILNKFSNAVNSANVTILATPTGSGKTLCATAHLAQNHLVNGGRCFVTVPRVLLAKGAMNAVNKIIFGYSKAGVMTGKVNERETSSLVFCTERSFLNRVKLTTNDILVIDEVHEQCINTEEVIFASTQHAKNGGKVVLMSATIDLSKFVKYFTNFGLTVETVELPEFDRPFLTKYEESSNPLKTIVELNLRTLIGVAGLSDIEKSTIELRKFGYKGQIFPLHSKVEEADEKFAMNYAGDCIYIATSVGMSGITFANLEVVLPPSVGKRVEDGVLVEYMLSEAEIKQWRGRVGRTKNGIVIIDTNLSGIEREKNPTPEILLADINEVVLSFANSGYNINQIQLLNQPNSIRVDLSTKFLIENNLIFENLELTEKGQFVISNGGGIQANCLAFAGDILGFAATSRKIAALLDAGSPFRKNATCATMNSFKGQEIFDKSKHLLIIKTIETDTKIDVNAAKELGIYFRGFQMLKREFARIDANFIDEDHLDFFALKELLNLGALTSTKFENRYNSHIGYVVNNSNFSKTFETLTPIQLKHGRLSEMTTSLD